MDNTRSTSEWPAILIIVFFFLTNLIVIFPFQVTISAPLAAPLRSILAGCRILPPQNGPPRRTRVLFDFRTVPILAVLILFAAGSLSGRDVRNGILGADGINPIDIMALFVSLAYMSISLDATGLFHFLAFWVARKGGSSGQKLYFYLYVFFLVCGIIFGNDPVILSGTAFLAYLTRIAGIVPPTAWIFAQFSAANMASAVLVSSNPTNLVLSGAFSISFTSYTAHVILPFLAAAICAYPVFTLVLFRSPELIPPSLDIPLDSDTESTPALVDKNGAIFGSALILVTLAVLVGASTVGVHVYQVTVPPAVIMVIRDVYHDWSQRVANKARCASPVDTVVGVSIPNAQEPLEMHTIPSSRSTPQKSQTEAISTLKPESATRSTLLSTIRRFTRFMDQMCPTVWTIAQRLPLALLPFAFLMFILVQGLSSKGWVEVFAKWWAVWVAKTGPVGAIGGMGFLGCVLCNICGTNIGTTILLAKVLQVWIAESTTPIDPRTREGAIYALALGSNYGAMTLSFSASLAGLLWRTILMQKGINVKPLQFMTLNVPIVATAMSVSCAVLVGEMYVLHR